MSQLLPSFRLCVLRGLAVTGLVLVMTACSGDGPAETTAAPTMATASPTTTTAAPSTTMTTALSTTRTTSPAAGDCYVGQVVGPGERCTYPGTSEDFWVDDSGRGNFIFVTTGTGISLRNSNLNGVVYDFEASKQADGTWLIEAVGTTTATTPTTMPAAPSTTMTMPSSTTTIPTTQPPAPVSATEFDDASSSERDEMFEGGRILRCREGLALPRDGFCVDGQAASLSDLSYLVAHLSDGDGLILQGGGRFQSGGATRLGWITYEKVGTDRVITHLDE